MTPPTTAPEPDTLPEEPDVEAPEHGNDVSARRGFELDAIWEER